MLTHISNDIPILEPEEEGYWEIYKDAEDKIIKRVWHQNQNISMVNSTLQSFQEKKKAQSAFITLSDDKESVSGVVKAIKQLLKVGFGGKEVEVIRLEMETKEGLKNFDKGSKQWVDELVSKEVDIGSDITITRHGIKDDKKTTYGITINKK